ncbi:MA3 domain-containing protein [Cephalotus follicularis]|uniref:MA3 domain-containing protein n=1 Tax=Cephalotus follicularis TaxID=3775 RepID=A0A1Q3DC59_CEPFO|nr:MA3 domain-containing protein [Cephalotus follicularis]
MELKDHIVTKERKQQIRSASETATDPLSVSPLRISVSPKAHTDAKGSPLKYARHSHSPKVWRPKKGGWGGKGTWGGLLDLDDNNILNPSDPNYDSSEECEHPNSKKSTLDFELFKKKATVIVEEYFATDDVVSTANELIEVGMPGYHYYFVKKLVSMAMDRHDKEKEMAAVLLSALYAGIIDPPQVHRGFSKLVESADDLIVDIPDTVDVLALFIARAVVDDILPPAFLRKQMASLSLDSKGVEVLKRAEKGYLSAPLHAEIIERRWGGSRNKTVEDVKARINNLLIEYVVSGDKKEACICIKDLKVPFFHHEIVKRALIMAMERHQAEERLLDLLKEAAEEGLVNSSQITKGFGRLIDTVDDLSLDIPNARGTLKSLISKAASEGWLCASLLKSFSLQPDKRSLEDCATKIFKMKAQAIIQEYFLSGDIPEVISCLEAENDSSAQLNAIFVKRLVTLAMDRKNREKEMASVLLSSLCFPADDVVNGFVLLIESADDTALDNPVVVEDLAMFLSRAVVDEVLSPQHLEDIENQFLGAESIGIKALQMAKSLLKARLSGERILRCWGGGGSSTPGCAVEDAKDKIGKLLEEYESGWDVREACLCIKELGMPFFHHEVVKKTLVKVMEKKNERLWDLLKECFGSGLITMNQMVKGFGRVAESLDDLALDVPDVKEQFIQYVERAKMAGWLDSSFGFGKLELGKENGFCL